MPTYCLSCRPRRKRSAQELPTKGMFHPTHYLIAANGRKTEVCLEKSSNPGWSWVRTALDWFSGSSIILTFHGIFGGEYKLGNNVR